MDEPLTMLKLLADIERFRAEIGPPPPDVRVSRYATGLPKAEPHTDDMRQMVERVGQQRVPAAYRIDGSVLGLKYDLIVIHPDLLPGSKP